MTLLEHERRASQRARRKQAKHQRRKQKRPQRQSRHALPLPAVLNDDQVFDFHQWCALNAISPRTGRRILASGDGPKVTQLSPHRIGITVRANREWQQSRSRG